MKGIIVSVAIVAVFAGLIPLITVTDYERVPYQAQVEKPLSYREIDNYAREEWDFIRGVYVDCFVLIKNTDTVPGTFVVDFTVTSSNSTFTGSSSAYILPGEVKTVNSFADIDILEYWEWERHITPGTKTVTELRYKEVEHEKKVSLLNYLLNY